MKTPSILILAAATGAAMIMFTPPAATATPGSPDAAARVSRTPEAVNGKLVTVQLRAGIKRIAQRAEKPSGYHRSKFRLWDDVNHDCQDTRSEVLRKESLGQVAGACTVRRGRWVSYYDDAVFTKASKLEIDHLVPLAEVWRSGGRSWSAPKREAYANDLTDGRTLVAVSAQTKRSKGNRDPSEWLPEFKKCTYVKSWVAVKIRWGLSADPQEKSALKQVASRCANSWITVRLARVVSVAPPAKHHSGGPSTTGTTSHACTQTSTGSCIRGGYFCPQASYGQAGYDAKGHRLVCGGDRTHPRWS